MILREAIESAVTDVRASAIEKDVAIHVDMRMVDECMEGDAHRIRQVFLHLLSNALKFTPRGGSVWLSARPEAGAAAIVVRDSGRGLAPGHQDWLFEPFRQADSSNTRRSGGIGLGLALARKIVEAHAGRIEAQSGGPHLGTTFTVSLPLAGRPALQTSLRTQRGPRADLAGLAAMVIDDQSEAREALSALLVQFGVDVRLADRAARPSSCSREVPRRTS